MLDGYARASAPAPDRPLEAPMSVTPSINAPRSPDPTAQPGQLVVPLSALDREALAVAGGKGANLGELLRAGFPVPPGFCLTTAAYDLAAARADLGPSLEALAAVA